MVDLFEMFDAVGASNLDPQSRLVLLWMARRAAGDGDAFPSWSVMIKNTGLARSTIADRIALLRRLGWLVDSGRRKGPMQRTVIYRVAVPMVREADPNGPGGGPLMVREADPEEDMEEDMEEICPPEVDAGQQPTAGETMTSDDQPTLFASPTAVRLSGGAVETTPAPPPPTPPSDVPRPFRSAAELAAYQEAATLWRTRARGTLRPHKTLDPTRGAGKALLRVIRHTGRADTLRAILWMTSSAEAEYLRDSSAPRGFDTLWNHRDDYPEKASEWLEREHAACVIAAAAGVPLPDGMPEVQPEPSPIDLEARAQERYDRINAARARQGLPPLPWRRGGAK